MNPQPDPELELLRAGLESYLPAMNAIVAFRAQLVQRCRAVMEKHLPVFAAALGVKLKTNDIQDWVGPTPAAWKGRWASVGAQLKDVGPDSVFLTLAVGWHAESPGEYTTGVSFWAYTQATTRAANELFLPHPENWWTEKDSFGFSTWHTPNDAPQLEEHLTGVFDRWIKLWRKVGGLKAVSGK